MPETETPSIGSRIRELRGERSAASLARQLDVSWETLWAYETGRRIPSVERLGQIADALGVNVSDLLEAA